MGVPKRVFSFIPNSSMPDEWKGAWRFGVDFAEKSQRVIAVHLGGSEIKYGLNWIGPIKLDSKTSRLLEKWAESILDVHGGYVHLFPADGDVTKQLVKNVVDISND